MVAPCDNIILRVDEFRESVEKAFEFIDHHDTLLTFGVKPTHPETRYGYIQQGREIDGDFAMVKTFTEKPDLELAKVFVDSGEFYWNTGIFFWSATSIIKALNDNAAKVSPKFREGEGIYGTDKEEDFIKEIYSASQSISIDYAVLEKADNVTVLRVDGIGSNRPRHMGIALRCKPKEPRWQRAARHQNDDDEQPQQYRIDPKRQVGGCVGTRRLHHCRQRKRPAHRATQRGTENPHLCARSESHLRR